MAIIKFPIKNKGEARPIIKAQQSFGHVIKQWTHTFISFEDDPQDDIPPKVEKSLDMVLTEMLEERGVSSTDLAKLKRVLSREP